MNTDMKFLPLILMVIHPITSRQGLNEQGPPWPTIEPWARCGDGFKQDNVKGRFSIIHFEALSGSQA